MAKKGIMYRILPFNGIWNNRDVSEVVNNAMNGKINATGEILMDSNEVTLTDERISPTSVILFSARSNSTFGLPFVKSKTKGSAIIGYSSGEAPSGSSDLPTKAIFLWDSPEIPIGYQVCDGTNDTPDLRDKFIMSAGATYGINTTGGSADAIVVTHSHGVTINEKTGLNGWWDFKNRGGSSYGTPILANSSGGKFTHTNRSNSGSYGEGYRGESGSGSSRANINVNHNHTGSVANSGSDGKNKNLPPYKTLYYITKIPASSTKATEEESIFDYVVLG